MPGLMITRLRQGKRTLPFPEMSRFCRNDSAACRYSTNRDVHPVVKLAPTCAQPTR